MQMLLDSDRPGVPATWDLARSCVRTWFECQLPASEWGAGPWWHVGLRLALQLPLAAATVLVTFLTGLSLLTWALIAAFTDVSTGRPSDPILLALVFAGPVAASGGIAIGVGLTRFAPNHAIRVTVSGVAAAIVSMAVVIAIVTWTDPDPAGSIQLQRLTSAALAALRNNVPWAFAYAAVSGLLASLVFRGLPLRRCVFNCVHAAAREKLTSTEHS